MRNFFKWTVIFRGGLIGLLINMVIRLVLLTIFIMKCLWLFVVLSFKIGWAIARIPIIIACWMLGIDWFRLQMSIQRKIRTYFA